jgi:1-acyl-sn-glycerol-3-phosphate acyltransferase
MASEDRIVDKGAGWARKLLHLAGWRIRFDGTPPGCGVIIAYPHTSNWDFVVGIVTVWAVGIPLVFLGKDSLFRIPLLGRLMRRWGGLPVDRSRSSGVITDMAAQLRAAQARGERRWLALAPEGTRQREAQWRSGFYHIAVQAGVPIGLAYFHFGRREIGVAGYLMPTGNVEQDLQRIAAIYAAVAQGLHPDLAAPIRFRA